MSVQSMLAMAATWGMGKIFFLLYHSTCWPQKASLYNGVIFAVFCVTGAAGHYYLAALSAFYFPAKRKRIVCVITASAIGFIVAANLAAMCRLASPYMAALPVVLSYLIGGLAGLATKDDKNPWRNSRITGKRLV